MGERKEGRKKINKKKNNNNKMAAAVVNNVGVNEEENQLHEDGEVEVIGDLVDGKSPEAAKKKKKKKKRKKAGKTSGHGVRLSMRLTSWAVAAPVLLFFINVYLYVRTLL